MRVAVIGGTGFVGSYLIDSLVDAGHWVSALVQLGSENKLRHAEQVRTTTGSLRSQIALDDTCHACDAVIYNVGILRESPRLGITVEETQYLGVERAIAAAKKAGARRFLLMSANGVKPHGTKYQETKYRAEELLRHSGLEFTIFRPSVIFGDPRGHMEFATQMYQDMVDTLLPAVGFHTGWNPYSGQIIMSPVHVRDVADAFTNALEGDEWLRKTLRLGGPEAITWRQIIERIANAVDRKKAVMPLSVTLMKLAAYFLDWIPQFPVTRDQLTMLAESNIARPDELTAILGRPPRIFDRNNLDYLARKRPKAAEIS